MKELSKMEIEEVLFDSQIDDWNINTSIFNERIVGKEKIVLMIIDSNGNVFGCYIEKEIPNVYIYMKPIKIHLSFH